MYVLKYAFENHLTLIQFMHTGLYIIVLSPSSTNRLSRMNNYYCLHTNLGKFKCRN